MATMYFFNGGAHGHINPTLGLVTELIRRGEEVIYYSTPEFKQTIERTGATFRAYPLDPEVTITDPWQMAASFMRTSEQLLPGLIETAQAEIPAYIIFDMFRLWGWHLSRYLGIPGITFSPSFITNQAVLEQVIPDFLHFLLSELGSEKEPNYGKEYAQTAARLRALYGVQSPAITESMPVMGDLTLVSTFEQFHPAAHVLDSRVKFIGASLQGRRHDPEFPLERLSGNTVITISLGTVFNNQLAFYQACLRAFANTEYLVVMSIGNKVSVESLGELPANFIVRQMIPQLDVLEHTDVFLTHAGMGSVHEALAFGVPMILYPQMTEQSLVAGQVEALGAGLALIKQRKNGSGMPTDGINAQHLRAVVETVLSTPSYKQRAVQLGQALRQHSVAQAADLVLNYVQEQHRAAKM